MDKSTWDRRYAEREFVWTVEPNRPLVQEAEGLRPGRALDLACGEGPAKARGRLWSATAARGELRRYALPTPHCRR